MRILHVVESFSGQATEAWLSRILCFDGFDFGRYQFDFFLTGRTSGPHASIVLEKGADIVVGSPGAPSIPRLTRSLSRCVRGKQYDVIHIHQDVLAGVFGLALLGSRVKLVTHAHNCWQRLPVGGRFKQRVLTVAARALTRRLSDAIVGASRPALNTLTGGDKLRGRIDRVVYCSAGHLGAVRAELSASQLALELRSRFGFPRNAKVILFVGRMDSYKNPIFAVEFVAHLVARRGLDACLLFVGPDKLPQDVQQAVVENGLEKRIKAAGWYANPGEVMRASDLVLVPSQECHSEGLGLVAVEAQGCGVPVICSLSVPDEAQIIPTLFRRISLDGGPNAWVNAALELLAQEKYPEAAARVQLKESAFSDRASYESLVKLYEDVCSKTTGQITAL